MRPHLPFRDIIDQCSKIGRPHGIGNPHHVSYPTLAHKCTPRLEEFLAGLDMFYLATASADGQPYIQYRGGPPGFLKVVDEKTLGFADFQGNQQYISTGNLSENPKSFIFLMDYVNSRRIKIWGNAQVVEDDPALLEHLAEPDYPGKAERAILFAIEDWDVNCPQHIHKRIPAPQKP